MKKLLFIALVLTLVGINEVKAQKVVEFRESQARVLEPQQNAYVKPLIVELEINMAKGKITDNWMFTNREVNALSGEVSNLRARALFNSTLKHNADVIVAATFDIASLEDGSGYEVKVIGYPANYKNWRTAETEDYEWIRMEKTLTTNESQKVQAVIKSK